MLAYFASDEGGFYDTSDDHETLITRPRELQDNATPSGNAMATTVLLKLGGLGVEPRYTELARKTLAPMQSIMAQYPLGFAQWLQALAYDLARPREIALVGDPGSQDTRAMLDALRTSYLPSKVVLLKAPGEAGEAITRLAPFLGEHRQMDGRATAFVCTDRFCRSPTTDTAEMLEQMAGPPVPS